ncbi:putative acetyltransferase EpsM [Caloramator mitchellensis]|uniref:Putative acetyltransferase EpsM n=1 Tax=Caloramator mitchellensis TaxID=908809 RepID=A0A0R3JWJ5_CALMK|nr:acetyltransferase [Caloramator mitchellensis]KRQ87434.1 putative acetyltransferase EpsM [Caloramator mitchellensis]
MKNIVIVGAGGHGRVILDILLAMKKNCQLNILGFIDDASFGEVLGYKILGKVEDLKDLKAEYGEIFAVPAIGDNFTRERVVKRLESLGINLFTAIHPTAVIGGNVTIEDGTVVMACAVINNSARIGKAVIINTSAVVEHDNVLGDYVHISPGAHLAGNVAIGDYSHVGTGANIIPGINIGKNVTVGAGSTVIRDVEDNAVAVGVPARVIKYK